MVCVCVITPASLHDQLQGVSSLSLPRQAQHDIRFPTHSLFWRNARPLPRRRTKSPHARLIPNKVSRFLTLYVNARPPLFPQR